MSQDNNLGVIKNVLGSYLIGIREGIEAALIISILASYLKKIGQANKIRVMFLGVFGAIVVSVLLGMVLSFSLQDLAVYTQENITGALSILAVFFITWMIFWMSKNSHRMGESIRNGVDQALTGSAIGIVAVAFLSVIREGLETSISLWSAAKATASGQTSIVGAMLGLLSAAVIGYLMYRGVVRINLGLFFKITGAYLILIAASILSYAFAEFNESGLLTVLNGPSYNLSHIISEGSALEIILKGAFGFMVAPTLLQSIIWVAYAVAVGFWYLKPRKTNF